MPVGVDEVHRQAERREVPAQQIMGATIEAALCQQVIPRRQHGEERGGDRRHAARGDQRGLRALQRRELGMQRELARGVVGAQVAHVVVAAFTAVLIGRGLEDRHLHRARDSRQRLAGVYQLGFDTHGGFRHWSPRKCDCHSNTLPCPHAFMERRAPAPRLALCRRAASTAARAGKSLRVRRPTERFSSRVEHYVRYRPSYPSAAIDLLKTRCGLSPAAVVADIGSGTGILTELLLASGAQVIGVEPNDAMRAAAEARFRAQARFRSVNGTAEATTLPPASIDLLVPGQAFHWFDVDRARREALRLLGSGAFAALLWNERPPEPTAFLTDYEALLLRHAAEYAQIAASRADEASMRRFFGGAMELAGFPHWQSFG